MSNSKFLVCKRKDTKGQVCGRPAVPVEDWGRRAPYCELCKCPHHPDDPVGFRKLSGHSYCANCAEARARARQHQDQPVDNEESSSSSLLSSDSEDESSSSSGDEYTGPIQGGECARS